ncbi:leucine-rich repeat protein soc-2-like [Drosophila guanche]|uniref:leucine-rich repeat protein soc-2-like n=1 Tax=Drosophila guanche TaxID=7266 RepID=UPI001470F361|nr:leucine-rich repeat protein soc-2-like [Drosophila guanche]
MDQNQQELHPLYPKCEEARSTGILDLKMKELTAIPQAVFRFMACAEADVKECDISDNKLICLQPQLPLTFHNLTFLNLAHNWLSSLPAEIGDLRALEVLDFSHNLFYTMPGIVYQLPHLTVLYAHCNCISEFDLTKPIATDRLDLVDLRNNRLSHSFIRKLLKTKRTFRLELDDDESDSN